MNNNKWILLVILSLIWGSSFILIKKSLLGFSPLQLGALRTVLTAVILITAGFKGLKEIPIHKWKWIAITGFVGSFFPAFFFAIAETQIDSSVTAIINSMVPLYTILLGLIIFGIQSSKRQLYGVLVGFTGTALLILKGASLNPNQNYFYAGFIIMSSLMYAANINMIKKYLQDVKPLTIASGNYVVIALPALIVLYASDFFSSSVLEHTNFWPSFGYISLLAIFGTALSKVFFNRLVQISSPVFASSVAYLIPLVSVFWGVIDGEKFSFLQFLAAFIILIGVYLSQRRS